VTTALKEISVETFEGAY